MIEAQTDGEVQGRPSPPMLQEGYQAFKQPCNRVNIQYQSCPMPITASMVENIKMQGTKKGLTLQR